LVTAFFGAVVNASLPESTAFADALNHMDINAECRDAPTSELSVDRTRRSGGNDMRCIGTLVATALLSASLAAPLTTSVRAETLLVIGYVTKSATNQGWVLINKGAQDAAREANVRLIVAGPSTQGALTSQIDAIDA
jgi:hypothetical protein